MPHVIVLSMDSQWLKIQFDINPDKSKAELAKALGLEPPAVSKILNGARQIKAQEYNMMRKFFGLPVDGEHAVRPSNDGYRLETLAGGQGLGESEAVQGDESWVIPAGILSQRTQASPSQIKIFKVQESLMEPDYKRGEHVLVDLSECKPSPPGVFIVSDGFGYMLRSCAYAPKSDPPHIKISAIASDFQTQTLDADEIDIIGRVIAKLQWL